MDEPKADDVKTSETSDVVAPQVPLTAGSARLEKLTVALPVDHLGTQLHVSSWRYVSSDRQPIVIVHDVGEQSEIYRSAAEGLVHRGYSVYVFDLRGHGHSGRRLGHAPSFAALVKDLLQVAAWVRHREGGKSPVLLGHGIGALITMAFTEQYGSYCRAAILSAPCLELTQDLSPLSRLAIKILADMFPLWRIPAAIAPVFTGGRIDGEPLTPPSPAPSVAGLEDDRRRVYFPRLTAVFTHELLAAIKRAGSRFIEYHGSVLILCPANDEICSYQQLKKSAAIHNANNLEIVDLKSTGHGVFTGALPAREEALGIVTGWLERVLTLPAFNSGKDEQKLRGASRIASNENEKPGATKA